MYTSCFSAPPNSRVPASSATRSGSGRSPTRHQVLGAVCAYHGVLGLHDADTRELCFREHHLAEPPGWEHEWRSATSLSTSKSSATHTSARTAADRFACCAPAPPLLPQ